MLKQLITKIKPVLKPLLIFSLVFVIVFGSANEALAARSGGRIGGGSFRTPSRTYTPPSGGYRGGYGYGGGFGFPFLLPFFGFGGGFGGLFTILIFIAMANFLVKTVRNVVNGGEAGTMGYPNPKVSVAKVQVALLSEARSLQTELDGLGRTADTGTGSGRAMVLQEATLALLRHPEYWVYGATESSQAALASAEAKFNQLALAERSKFSQETLSNVNSRLRQALSNSLDEEAGDLVKTEDQASGEYIVVTLVVGIEGKLELPKINDAEDLKQSLSTIGGLAGEKLLAMEILWTPQAEGDTLTSDDILAQYPDLKLV